MLIQAPFFNSWLPDIQITCESGNENLFLLSFKLNEAPYLQLLNHSIITIITRTTAEIGTVNTVNTNASTTSITATTDIATITTGHNIT